MKRAAFAVCVVLGCSGSQTQDAGGTGGGSAAGGGSGGGDASSDAGFQFISTADGLTTLAIPAGLDASTYSVSRLGAGFTLPADGGAVVQLGPDGAQFSPAAGVLVLHQVDQSDSGFTMQYWFLESADGGREAVEAVTRFNADDDGPALASTAMAVPHFTRGWTTRGTTSFTLNADPRGRRVFLVGEAITFRFESSDYESVLGGNLTLRTQSGPLAAATNTVQLGARTTQARFTTVCTSAGLATVQGEAFFAAYAESELGGAAKPGQTLILNKSILCAWPPSPANPQTMLDPGDPPPPGPEGAAPAVAISALLGNFDTRRELDVSAFTTTFDAACGVGGKPPCKRNQVHQGTLTLVNMTPGPVLLSGKLRAKDIVAFGVGGSQTSHTFAKNLTPQQPQTETFLFVCLADGYAYVDVVMTGQRPTDLVADTGAKGIGTIHCEGQGDAVMLSDNTRLTRSGNTWNAAATGVTANLISATDSIAPKFGALSSSSVGLDGVAQFTGRVGLPRFRFQSARQSATWTHTGNGYAQTGLVGGAAYNATDSLTVTGLFADGGVALLPDGGNAVVVLSAPPPLPAPAQMFGPRSGLTTPMRLPDGTFDVLYVAITAPSPLGGTGGVFRTVRAADMTLDAGVRETPLLDNPALQALAAWGIDAGTVYIAAYRQQDTEGFFTDTDGGARSVPVQAGRMIQVSVPDLLP